MACDQKDCVVRTVTLAPKDSTDENEAVVRAGGEDPAGPDEKRNVNAGDAQRALIERARSQIPLDTCPKGCRCVPDENAAPKVMILTVPVEAIFKRAGTSDNTPLTKVKGTVRIRRTETPGICFDAVVLPGDKTPAPVSDDKPEPVSDDKPEPVKDDYGKGGKAT